MDLDGELNGLVERELDALGYELVKADVYQSGRRKYIRLFIDRGDQAVTIDDCVRVTKALGLVLDGVETLPGPYNLEVSSPGFTRPLTKPAHFARFRGERARVEYFDALGAKTTAIGRIVAAAETSFTLSADGVERVIAFESVMRANLHPVAASAPEAERREPRGERRGKRL
ncbi:MAG: ribosome maturation factor RimP [Candidatus Krumholzibacteriaceae bacterium]|jgi:ribosome maturation factor RimP